MATIYDIETAPLDEDYLKAICPPFDPESVKCGNLKDPAKIKAKIEEAEDDHFTKFIDRAALDASTGRICAIGYKNGNGHELDLDPEEIEEDAILIRFWKRFEQIAREKQTLVGFNSNRFDVPFIVRRSFILGIPVPSNVIEGRYLNKAFVDIADRWFCGSRGNNDYVSLDFLAKALGGQKEDIGKKGSGANFHKLLKEDRTEAEKYLRNDLDVTEFCGRKLQVI